MSGNMAPLFLSGPVQPGEWVSMADATTHLGDAGNPTDAGLAEQWAHWADHDFESAFIALVGDSADERRFARDALVKPGRGRVRMPSVAGLLEDSRRLVLHAALVGIARGSSREAFEYAEQREVFGKALIRMDLLAARLSDVATHEVIAELQFGRMLNATNGLAGDVDRQSAEAEIRRAALRTAVEGAQIRGGHGFVQRDLPGKRVEAAGALLYLLDGGGAR